MVDVEKIKSLLRKTGPAPWSAFGRDLKSSRGDTMLNSVNRNNKELLLALVNSAEAMLDEIERGRELRRKVGEMTKLFVGCCEEGPCHLEMFEEFMKKDIGVLCAEYDAAVKE